MRLGDLDALKYHLEDLKSFTALDEEHDYYMGETNALGVAIGCVERALTVDAVPVVRCKDCKYGEMRKNYFGDVMVECSNPDSPVRDYALTALFRPDWFCADGERKEDKPE